VATPAKTFHLSGLPPPKFVLAHSPPPLGPGVVSLLEGLLSRSPCPLLVMLVLFWPLSFFEIQFFPQLSQSSWEFLLGTLYSPSDFPRSIFIYTRPAVYPQRSYSSSGDSPYELECSFAFDAAPLRFCDSTRAKLAPIVRDPTSLPPFFPPAMVDPCSVLVPSVLVICSLVCLELVFNTVCSLFSERGLPVFSTLPQKAIPHRFPFPTLSSVDFPLLPVICRRLFLPAYLPL